MFHNLAALAQGKEFNWEPFQPGVERAWLYQTGNDGPAAALIRFQAGSRVPLHEHMGYEHIYILSGSQEDANGEVATGALVVNLPGTRHRIFSRSGCLALAIYEKPVRFIEDAADTMK
jgi:anti-sigma factor ChrR (cupin superfamily)